MKKLLVIAIPLLIVFAFFQNSYAKTYYRTFEVAGITSQGIVLKDFEGSRYLVEKKVPRGLKVGDRVRYDTVRDVLKISPWQPATVTGIGNNTITLKMNNGENLDVTMRSQYRGKFNHGDQVLYKESSGQIKKSRLQKLEDD